MIRFVTIPAILVAALSVTATAQTPGGGGGGGGGGNPPAIFKDSATVFATTSVKDLQGRAVSPPDKVFNVTDAIGTPEPPFAHVYDVKVPSGSMLQVLSLPPVDWGSRVMLADVPTAEAEVVKSTAVNGNYSLSTSQTSVLLDKGNIGIFSGSASSTSTCRFIAAADCTLSHAMGASEWHTGVFPAPVQPTLFFEILFNGAVVRRGTVTFVPTAAGNTIEVRLSDAPLYGPFVINSLSNLPNLMVPAGTEVEFRSVCGLARPNANAPAPPNGNQNLTIGRSLTVQNSLQATVQ